MQGRLRIFTLVAIMAMGVVTTGCNGQKNKLAMLEEENKSLSDQLETLRGEMDAAKQRRDRCEEELLAARQQLQGQFASKTTDLPGEWQSVPGGAMLAVPGNVLFDSGKIVLRNDSTSVLSKIASEIKSSFADKEIYVFGHTDTDPIKKSGWKDNRQLSSERSLAVVRNLQSQGLDPKKLVACAVGEHRPVASNSSKDGKARNRRVEIFAVDPAIVSAR